MDQSTTIESPRLYLADLFLDAFSQNNNLSYTNQSDVMGQTFSQILDSKVRSAKEELSYSSDNHLSGKQQNEEVVRRSTVDELRRQTSEIGVPLESLTINNDEDLNRLKKVMHDSGLTTEQVNEVMSKLKEGPVTMDKVMAALSTVQQKSGEKLTLSEESLPLLGNFLKDLGFSAEKVNEITDGLKAGQKFGAEALKDLLVKNGDQNLKSVDLSKVDPENLRSLLSSIGVEDSEINGFLSKLRQTGGRISLEAFGNYLKAVERPQALKSDQLNNIKDLVSNLSLSSSLTPKFQFDRIVSLMQSMGDQQANQKFMSDNPAIQALRGGAMSAQAVTSGTGAFGGANQGQSEGFGANQKHARQQHLLLLGRGIRPQFPIWPAVQHVFPSGPASGRKNDLSGPQQPAHHQAATDSGFTRPAEHQYGGQEQYGPGQRYCRQPACQGGPGRTTGPPQGQPGQPRTEFGAL